MKTEDLTEKLSRLAMRCYGFSENIKEEHDKGFLSQFRDNPTQRLDTTLREMEDLISYLNGETSEFYKDHIKHYGFIVDREFAAEFGYDLVDNAGANY